MIKGNRQVSLDGCRQEKPARAGRNEKYQMNETEKGKHYEF